MSNIVPYSEIEKMAAVLCKNRMFGKTLEEMLPLMLIAQAEGKHPALAAQEWDIIQGRPALKSTSALARFQNAGGKVQWTERSDTRAAATFTHPSGGSVEIVWTIERAKQAQLTGKDNWKKFPAQMLSARVSAEGVRACYPAALSGFYVTEEVEDMPRTIENINATLPKTEKIEEGDEVAFKLTNCASLDELAAAWKEIPNGHRTKYQALKDEAKSRLAEVIDAEVG